MLRAMSRPERGEDQSGERPVPRLKGETRGQPHSLKDGRDPHGGEENSHPHPGLQGETRWVTTPSRPEDSDATYTSLPKGEQKLLLTRPISMTGGHLLCSGLGALHVDVADARGQVPSFNPSPTVRLPDKSLPSSELSEAKPTPALM